MAPGVIFVGSLRDHRGILSEMRILRHLCRRTAFMVAGCKSIFLTYPSAESVCVQNRKVILVRDELGGKMGFVVFVRFWGSYKVPREFLAASSAITENQGSSMENQLIPVVMFFWLDVPLREGSGSSG